MVSDDLPWEQKRKPKQLSPSVVGRLRNASRIKHECWYCGAKNALGLDRQPSEATILRVVWACCECKSQRKVASPT